jgi:hypothetical protein
MSTEVFCEACFEEIVLPDDNAFECSWCQETFCQLCFVDKDLEKGAEEDAYSALEEDLESDDEIVLCSYCTKKREIARKLVDK